MKKMITLTLLALSLCFMASVRAMEPMREPEAPQRSETQKATVSESTSKQTTKATTTTKSTTRATTGRRATTAEDEETTATTMTSTESSTTTSSTSANNSVLFGKNKMLAIAAWTLIGIGVLVVLIVVLGGKSRRHRKPFQKSTKRYKNKSKHSNYSDRYRTNIKRK